VLHLRVFGAAPTIAVVARQLEELAGARHVLRTEGGAPGSAQVTADLHADVADRVLEGCWGWASRRRTWTFCAWSQSDR
jgi:hypothetical protein